MKNKIFFTVIMLAVVLVLGLYVFYFNVPNDSGSQNSETQNDQSNNHNNQEQKTLVSLFFYNLNKDKQIDEYIPCSRDAVLPVNREINKTQTPIQDTIRLLLAGGLTNEEKSSGFNTEFPLEEVELKGANLNNGTLTLEFNDPLSKTTGGSCRASLLWFQIEKTALQFEEVKKVEFKPDFLFQP